MSPPRPGADASSPPPAVPREGSDALARLFDLTRDLLAVASVETGLLVRAGSGFARLLGWSEDDLAGIPFIDLVHPEDLDASRDALAALAEGRDLVAFENRALCKDGTYRWVEWQIAPDPGAGLIYAAGRDVTDRRRREANLAVLADLAADLARVSSERDVFDAVGARLAARLGAVSVHFTDIDAGAETATIRAAWGPRADALAGEHALGDFLSGAFVEGARDGETAVVRDVYADPRATGDAVAFASVGIGAFVAVPTLRDGVWTHLFVVAADDARDWRSDEVGLVEEVAARVVPWIERARAEAEVRESEERYRALFESVTVGFCIVDLAYDESGRPVDYCYLEVNPTFEAQTGLSDVEGQCVSEVVPGLEPYWFEMFGRVAETGEPARRLDFATTLGRWFDVYAARVGGAGSRRVALLFTDVTEQKEAERALHLRDEHKALLLGLLTDLREEADPRGALAAAAETLGRYLAAHRVGFFELADDGTLDSGTGPTWSDGTLEPLSGQIPAVGLGTGYLARLRAGDAVGVEDTATDPLTADSAFPKIGVRSGIGVPILRGGRWVAGLFVDHAVPRTWSPDEVDIARDVAEQTWTAVERAQAQAALQESEGRFRSVVDAADAVIYTKDLEGRYTLANRAWGELFGRAPESILGETDHTYFPDAVAEALRANDRAVAAAGRPLQFEEQAVIDDETRTYLSVKFPLTDAEGAVRGVGGISTDITAIKRAEVEIQALNDELEDRVEARTAELARSNAELDQFAYVASHDLKAPLRAIDSLAAWIDEDAGDRLPPESARHLGLLRARTARMEGLLDGLLAYSRAGRAGAEPEPVDTTALVREVAETVAPPEGFDVRIEGDFPVVVTARAPLALVLRNLVGNAIKHHDRPDGRVTVSAEADGGWAAFTVEDDGPGIAPEYRGRVFGLFQTLRPRDEVEGSGMGLAVVKKTVEARGGRVTLGPAEGGGAMFRFTWPLSADASQSR